VLFISVTLIAFFVSFIITPFIARLGKKQNLVDKPGYRKIHNDAIPNLGGIVIFFGFLFSILIFVPLQKQIQLLIAGSIIILLLGIVDDITDLKPLNKILIQMIPALIFIVFHSSVINQFIWQKLSFFNTAGYLLYPILLLWIVGVTNSINLIDGLDGLASGISIIALSTLLILGFFVDEGYQTYNLLNAALLGSIIAFFRYNFFPAQIFLGDSGSTFSGFLISSSSILWVIYSDKVLFFIIPVLLLGLPIFDTFFAIWRRYRSHKPIFQADQGHLHHRLLKRGISHRNVVLFLLSISFICGMTSLFIFWAF
jgi:UDP-GlcNAc:undecaprenyl-phosphate GlcNAc-1-phosphate transferase